MKTDLVVGGYIFSNNKLLLIHHAKLDLWLPLGGHIDPDEIPDDAMMREAREEMGLDIELIGECGIPQVGNMSRKCKLPFHVSIHNVGDHDHCCFFYVCKAINADKAMMNEEEVKNYGWFSREDLHQSHIPDDVREIGLKAFEVLESGR